MITFVDRRTTDLDDLIVDLEAIGPVDIVSGGRTKARALQRFALTLELPEWFGHNLDALYELLDERAHQATGGGQDWTLLWSPGRRLIRDHPRDYAGIVSVLRDVADPERAEQGHGGRVVVVHGPDPRAAADVTEGEHR